MVNTQILAVIVFAFHSGPAVADQLEISGAVQFDTLFEDDEGFRHSENKAQLTLSGEYEGFELELEAQSLNDSDPDHTELTLTFGYTGAITENVEWSASYARTYLDTSGWDGEELSLGLEAQLSDMASAAFSVSHDLEENTNEVELGLEITATESLAFGVVVGHSSEEDALYGEFVASYSVTDAIAFEALFEREAGESGVLTLSAIWSFSLMGE